LLATLYNREILTAEQALIYALTAMDRFKKEGLDSPDQVDATNAQITSAEDNLRALGMGDQQIQEIARTRKRSQDIVILSPVSGLVLSRNIYPGLRFERGTELYRLVDLSRVWILADLFQNEAHHFRPGVTARVAIPHQKISLPARVTDVPPQFDPATRTLKVRLEAANPGLVLRPDMFVDVELPVRLEAAVAVPADAVLDSGLRKTVFVDRGGGSFEPRQVETGWRMGDRVQVTRGLQPGERVVASGAFLLDSEARMKGAAAAKAAVSEAVAKDPSCGMEMDPARAAGKAEYKGRIYYFCSRSCQETFEKDPARYAGSERVAEAGGPHD
jgi:membrane fusion protein, copper/silver efflux system